MKKLYDEDSYISEFSGVVTACIPEKNGYKIILDQTAFFPTAGGQECDSGILDGQRVFDVTIEDEVICHYVKEPVEIGKNVQCKIEWQARFRKMQHHSAEHIISGLMYTKFGFSNTGFHLSDREVTMDYSGVITYEQLEEIESLANEAVWNNLKITAEYPSDEKLSKIDYRSKLELTENVRIVTIDGIDCCACCAPHVKTTGEVGMIKLTDMMHHRGGIRIRMICGRDALSDYQNKHNSTLKISALLAVKQEETAEGVERVLNDLSELKQRKNALLKKLATQKASALSETEGNICIFEDEQEILKTLAELGREKCSGVCAVIAGNDENGYNYVICSNNVDLKSVSDSINHALSGRGGGRDMLSGRFNAKKTAIEEFFKNTSF